MEVWQVGANPDHDHDDADHAEYASSSLNHRRHTHITSAPFSGFQLRMELSAQAEVWLPAGARIGREASWSA
jgi:hypothetical protein